MASVLVKTIVSPTALCACVPGHAMSQIVWKQHKKKDGPQSIWESHAATAITVAAAAVGGQLADRANEE
jgi:hypothetical protein